jgi:hypothetical protein
MMVHGKARSHAREFLGWVLRGLNVRWLVELDLRIRPRSPWISPWAFVVWTEKMDDEIHVHCLSGHCFWANFLCQGKQHVRIDSEE